MDAEILSGQDTALKCHPDVVIPLGVPYAPPFQYYEHVADVELPLGNA
jgi:hypothetical protein